MGKRRNKKGRSLTNNLITVILFFLTALLGFSALVKEYSTPVINFALGILALFFLMTLADHIDRMSHNGRYRNDGCGSSEEYPTPNRQDDIPKQESDRIEHIIPNLDIEPIDSEKPEASDIKTVSQSNEEYVDFEPDFDINQKVEEKPEDSEYQQLED